MIEKIIDKIISLFKKIEYHISYESCYRDMERLGNAIAYKCSGMYGGDKHTNYLSYQCIECPYCEHKGENK